MTQITLLPGTQSSPFHSFQVFNYHSTQDWANLTWQIEGWLLTIPTESQQWTWGQDAFWLAFISTYPTFSHSKWPLWDARILLEGPFIEHWLLTQVWSGLNNLYILQQIWLEFQSHVALFSPYPLFSDAWAANTCPLSLHPSRTYMHCPVCVFLHSCSSTSSSETWVWVFALSKHLDHWMCVSDISDHVTRGKADRLMRMETDVYTTWTMTENVLSTNIRGFGLTMVTWWYDVW